MKRLALACAALSLGCASTLQKTVVYDPATGNPLCESRVSSRILGTGETEMQASNACSGAVAYSTKDTGLSENAKDLGVLGIKAAVQSARPGGQLEGALSGALSGAIPVPKPVAPTP